MIQAPPPPPPAPLAKQQVASHLPPPPPAPKLDVPHVEHVPSPKTMKVNGKWVIVEEDLERWHFDPKKCHPLDIRNLDRSFRTAAGFSTSASESSEGVVFLGWKDNGVVVLKASGSVMADYYAHILAAYCKISMPFLRIARYPVDPDWEHIYSTMHLLNSRKIPAEQVRARKFLEKVIYAIQDWVRGDDILHAHPKAIFGDPKPNQAGLVSLFETGRIIAFDMLINNWDRFPLKGVWSHEGNMANILYSHDGKQPVAIDQTVVCIDAHSFPEKYAEYVTGVENVLKECVDFGKKPTPVLNDIREYLKTNFAYDIGQEGLKALRDGITQGVKDISSSLNHEILEKHYNELNKQVEEMISKMSFGADTLSRYGMCNIIIDFLESILKLYKRYVPLL